MKAREGFRKINNLFVSDYSVCKLNDNNESLFCIEKQGSYIKSGYYIDVIAFKTKEKRDNLMYLKALFRSDFISSGLEIDPIYVLVNSTKTYASVEEVLDMLTSYLPKDAYLITLDIEGYGIKYSFFIRSINYISETKNAFQYITNT